MTNTDIPQPIRSSDAQGWLDLGPRDIHRDRENPDVLVPPDTDDGTLANMKFSFSSACRPAAGPARSPTGSCPVHRMWRV